MNGMLTVAGLEIRMGFRNRWIIATTALMTVLALSITLLGSSPTGVVGADPLAVSIVSLASLTIFLVPLMALLLSFDSIVGEVDQGTMLLMLSYPVSRPAVVGGKFIGGSLIIGFATLVGYGVAGGLLALMQETSPAAQSWFALLRLVGSASLLGAAFVGLGLLCSSITSQRGAAAGLAVSLWLLFVIVFDLALLGGLVAGLDRAVSEDMFAMLLLMNPADAFRMLNMDAVSGSGLVSGMAEVASNASLSRTALWGSLLLWSLVPLGAAIAGFRKRDI